MNRLRIAALVFILSTVHAFAADAPPARTVAILEIDWITEAAQARTEEPTNTNQVVMHPIATFSGGKWISANAFDGTGENADTPVSPKSEKETAAYWEGLKAQPYFNAYDKAVTFTTKAYEQAQGALEEKLKMLSGEITGATLKDYSENMLVWNSDTPAPKPEAIAKFEYLDRVLPSMKTAMKPAEDEIAGSDDPMGFDRTKVQAPSIVEAIRFRLDADRDAYWVHARQNYTTAERKEEEPEWQGHYFAIVACPRGKEKETAEWSLLWQYAMVDTGEGMWGSLREFKGALDVSGDGTAEVVVEEVFYERSYYTLLELNGKQFKLVSTGWDLGV